MPQPPYQPAVYDGQQPPAEAGSGLPLLQSFTVAQATALSAAEVGQLIYVTDEVGGAVPAFSDGTEWRRVTDRSPITA